MLAFVLSRRRRWVLGLTVSQIIARCGMPDWWCCRYREFCSDAAWRRCARRSAPPPTAGRGSASVGLGGRRTVPAEMAQIARANLAFAVGLMVLLMIVTVGYLPLVLPFYPERREFRSIRRRLPARCFY